jgi:hypothetical protein
MKAAMSGVDVGGERRGELRLVEEQEAVDGRQDRRHGRTRGRVGDQRVDGLAGVGREGGDVDERLDVGVVAGLGDDGPAVGVADEDGVLVLIEHPAGDGDVVGERDRRVLYDGDLVTGLAQDAIDGLPAGAVDEAAVDENDAAG